MDPRSCFIFDATHLLYRCAWQVAGKRKMDEPAWGDDCVSGVLMSVRSVLYQYGPTAAYIIWDGGRSERRTSLFGNYKSQRAVRSTSNHEGKLNDVVTLTGLLRNLGCRVISLPKREGDDVIHLTVLKLGGGTVVSDDKDFLTLVASGVSVFRPTTNSFVTYNFFAREFGVCPEQYLLLKCLSGDTSDNIPGIPGVGTKTGIKILTQFPDARTPEDLVANLMMMPRRTKVQNTIIDSLDDLKRNLELFDTSKELFTSGEVAAVENTVRGGVTFDSGVLKSLIEHGLSRVADHFQDWSVPFRRLT